MLSNLVNESLKWLVNCIWFCASCPYVENIVIDQNIYKFLLNEVSYEGNLCFVELVEYFCISCAHFNVGVSCICIVVQMDHILLKHEW